MVRYSIEDVEDDMVLGESIILPGGKLLLAAGQRLQTHYRQRLKELGYSNVLVDVEGTEEVVPQSTVSETTMRSMNIALSGTSEEVASAFHAFRDGSVGKIKQFIRENRRHFGHFIMNSGLVNSLEQFIEEIANQPSIVLNLSALQQAKASLINHALNVAIIALCIGRKYNFTYEEMKQLGIGALNYDLGLIALPRELLEKQKAEFDESEIKLYRQHPIFGYIMLTQNRVIPATSTACALQHHEREDGSGFPRGMKGENRPPLKDFSRKGMFHRFAEIVAIADAYDLLISGRVYEGVKKGSSSEAVKLLIEKSGTFFNCEIVKTLLSIIPLFPVGARVRISDAPTPQLIGYHGVVAKDNPRNLAHPQLILYETRHKQKIKPILVDLSKHSGFALELLL